MFANILRALSYCRNLIAEHTHTLLHHTQVLYEDSVIADFKSTLLCHFLFSGQGDILCDIFGD
jgi:hypothetical protein